MSGFGSFLRAGCIFLVLTLTIYLGLRYSDDVQNSMITHENAETTAASSSPQTTVIIGPGNPGDPCTVEIDKSVLAHLEEIGIREWSAACQEARKTDASINEDRESTIHPAVIDRGSNHGR